MPRRPATFLSTWFALALALMFAAVAACGPATPPPEPPSEPASVIAVAPQGGAAQIAGPDHGDGDPELDDGDPGPVP